MVFLFTDGHVAQEGNPSVCMHVYVQLCVLEGFPATVIFTYSHPEWVGTTWYCLRMFVSCVIIAWGCLLFEMTELRTYMTAGFLELVNNMLTSGMVPALFPDDEKEQIIGQVWNFLRELLVKDQHLRTYFSLWWNFFLLSLIKLRSSSVHWCSYGIHRVYLSQWRVIYSFVAEISN